MLPKWRSTVTALWSVFQKACAPRWAVFCGSKEFIEKARRNRQLLGGGMRQAGFVAACGIIALEKMVDRLADDHDNAKYMAHRLNKIKGVNVLMDNVDVNMVFFKLDKPKEFIYSLPGKMLEYGIILCHNRLDSVLNDTAEEKYENLEKRMPGLTARISAINVASYIGVTQETLCRIKSKEEEFLLF